MVRTIARISAVAMLALPMAFIAANPAAAAVVQTCGHVQGTATFTPGLTNTPTDNVVQRERRRNELYAERYHWWFRYVDRDDQGPEGFVRQAGHGRTGDLRHRDLDVEERYGHEAKHQTHDGNRNERDARERLRNGHVRPVLLGVNPSSPHHPDPLPGDWYAGTGLHGRPPGEERGVQQHQAVGHSVTDTR